MNNSRKAIDREGSTRRVSSEIGGNPGVNQRDDTPSRGVGGREVNSVRREDVLKCSEVLVGRGTNILDTNNVVSFQQGLEVRNDLEVASNQTTRKREAARVDVSGDNGGKFEL